MPPLRKPTLITLRRQSPNQAWGFRLGGGAEIGQPFQIQKVTPNSVAFLGGISEGDELVRIGNVSLRGLTHDEVQQLILRCTHCIDLFLFRDNGSEIEPRYLSERQSVISERTENVYQERLPHQLSSNSGPYHMPPFPPPSPKPVYATSPEPIFNMQPAPVVNSYHPASSNTQEFAIEPHSPAPVQFNNFNNYDNQRQDFNRSPKPFDSNMETSAIKTVSAPIVQNQIPTPSMVMKPGSPVRDHRVFGINPRSSKSPVPQLNHSMSQDSPHEYSVSPIPHETSKLMSQSIPSTPTVVKNFNFVENDFNNNPVREDKKVFGLQNRGASKQIYPIGNHGVQPVANEKRVFGLNPRQRFNSISSDRDWKSSLPIVNIPNTDQLLPSQTKQMQTYINQVPPTEKNLRPSLIGVQRRRIRPVWPPPLPNRMSKSGVYVEGRDSPNSKMFNWPPAGQRAQSVDRDFGYGEAPRYGTPPPGDRSQSPFFSGRVRRSSNVWPPPSNATPAGRSGYIPDENDIDNYAYTPSREMSPAPGRIVGAHIPATYRPPPGTQYVQVVDF